MLMTKTRYRFAGRGLELNVGHGIDPQITRTLQEELGLYEQVGLEGKAEVVVNVADTLPKTQVRLVNPAIHLEVEDGFIVRYKGYAIMSRKRDGQVVFDVEIERRYNPVVNYLRKLNNIQYNSVAERVGHILFENVLIPAIYFDADKFLLHASAFQNENGDAVLVGGTGGVGKTSLELELCIHRGFGFLADDMGIITKTGLVYPNLAFPKVYGYNLRDNSDLKKRIMKGRSLPDQFAWKFRQTLFGDSGVRRKVSPRQLYARYLTKPANLRHYIILLREARDNIESLEIDSETAAAMSINVLLTELGTFNNHVLWHEYNCLVEGRKPILSLQETVSRWRALTRQVLAGVKCQVILIPLKIEHETFINKVSNLITALN